MTTTQFVDAIELENVNPSSADVRHKLDPREIIAVESENFYPDDLPGFRRVTLKSGTSWLAKIDATSLAAARARVESTILPNSTGWRAVFRHRGERGAWVELLPIIGWRSYSDGRPVEPVFALETGGDALAGYVDDDGYVIPRTAAARRGLPPIQFVDWLQKYMLEFYRQFPPRSTENDDDEAIISAPLLTENRVDHDAMAALIRAHLDTQSSSTEAEQRT